MTQTITPLTRFANKKFVFEGQFGYRDGHRERLLELATAQSGTVVEELDATVDYLIIPDAMTAKTAQKKAQSLIKKGSPIQVLEMPAFEQLSVLSDADILALVLRKKVTANLLASLPRDKAIVAHSFDALDLSDLKLGYLQFDRCSFIGSKIDQVYFTPRNSDFSKSHGKDARFASPSACRFIDADLPQSQFDRSVENIDFTRAKLECAIFGGHHFPQAGQTCFAGTRFISSFLRHTRFASLWLRAPDFSGANLEAASFSQCKLESPVFKNANLKFATLFACQLPGADFSNADLRNANLAQADLTGARFDGADIAGCNFAKAILVDVDLTKAKNHDQIRTEVGSIGPSLSALDSLTPLARQIKVSFLIRKGPDDQGEVVSIDSSSFRWGGGVTMPQSILARTMSTQTFSNALLTIAHTTGQWPVRYESLEIDSNKCPKPAKELRELVIAAIAEAFDQKPPRADQLAVATKEYQHALAIKNHTTKEELEAAKAKAAEEALAQKQEIEKKIETEVGKVNDTASFLKALELRIDADKIKKATKMLKASGFKLFNDVTATHVNGVVKSQTDPDLVYACRIESDGKYACCTQNLNVCGGLRGSICKHLLVLIIGLVQANELDPATINDWVAKSNHVKPVLDKETMGEVFIRYKGAEAGEVDWRPTETVPEDYYSL